MGPRRGAPTPPADVPPRDQVTVADEATFAMERVPPARGLRAPAIAALLLVGLAILGTLGSGPRVPAIAKASLPTATSAATPQPVLDWGAPKRGDDRSMPTASELPLLVIDATVDAGTVFVNGDVFTIDADVVVVSLQDLGDRTIDSRRLQMPGGSTAMRTGPNDRFSLLFRVAGPFDPRKARVTAVALDDGGDTVATAIVQLESRAERS